MRVMVIVKANEQSEAGVLPDKEILTKMGAYNEHGDVILLSVDQPVAPGSKVG